MNIINICMTLTLACSYNPQNNKIKNYVMKYLLYLMAAGVDHRLTREVDRSGMDGSSG